MNTDGHNGFHFTTVSPGMSGYPDKFIHLDDVVPVDTTPPTEPTDVRVAAHRGRTGITLARLERRLRGRGLPRAPQRRAARDRPRHVLPRRQPARPARPPSTRWSPSTPPGTASRPGRVTVLPGHRVGRPGLGRDRPPGRPCVAGPAREAAAARLPAAGRRGLASGRAVPRRRRGATPRPGRSCPSPDGSVSYCRAVGRTARALVVHRPRRRRSRRGAPTGSSRQHAAPGRRRHLGEHARRARPAAGSPGPHAGPPRPARCSPWHGLAHGDHPRARPWGDEDGRAFLADPGRRDRLLPLAARRPRRPHARAPTSNPFTLTWGADRVSGRPALPAPRRTRPGWRPRPARQPAGRRAPTDAAPAACSARPAGAPSPCPARRKPGTAGTRAFLTDRVRARRPGAALGRAAPRPAPSSRRRRPRWKTGRSTRTAPFDAGRQPHLGLAGRPAPRCAAGPAPCVSSGSPARCSPTPAGATSASHVASWGNPGYRAFVPSGSGRRVLPDRAGAQERRGRLVHPMSKLEWGATRTSQRVPLVLPDLVLTRPSQPRCATSAPCACARASGTRLHSASYGGLRGGPPRDARCIRSRHRPTSASTSRGMRDQRRAVDRGVARLHHPGVELLELAAYLGLGGVSVEPARRARRRPCAAGAAGGRTPVIFSRSIEPLDPPVGVVLGAEVLDRLAGAGQVVELAALHGQAQLLVDPLVLALHPLRRGGSPVRSSRSRLAVGCRIQASSRPCRQV